MIGWDSGMLRAPTIPWAPLHHIKQEPMEPSMTSGFLSSNSEGFRSSSPSSSSRGSPPAAGSPQFHPLTPPGFGSSPAQPRPAPQMPVAVTPPKSPSPSPPWADSSEEGVPSPGDSSPDGEEEPGLRVPAVNSHGKVKTFKCKQCEFVAVTKLSFWEHTKSHIKPERMLNCPKCPFVTEYKHHLEYHMRNHFGSKPFQCTQCSYSCVNKSMLNSHLKSHSNVYQYRCSDCNYATKYCHSLKLHLRKYQHQPAMVLNQDGTPNPLPIIDVYGTRRGPKQRPQNKDIVNNNSMPAQHPLFQNPFGMNFPYGSLLPHPMLFPNNNNTPETPLGKPDENSSPSKDDDIPMRGIRDISPHLLMQQRFFTEFNQQSPPFVPPPMGMMSPEAPMHSPRAAYSPRPSSGVRASPRVFPNEDAPSDALDLTSASAKQGARSPAPLTPTANLKNRRKGRAFKLDRSVPRVEQADDEVYEHIVVPDIRQVLRNHEEEMDVETEGIVKEERDVEHAKETEVKEPNKKCNDASENVETKPKECYDCQYCGIIFKDIIMYTMHMGYHGFKDPFTCNMCGERSSDKVSFFVHIARSQHS